MKVSLIFLLLFSTAISLGLAEFVLRAVRPENSIPPMPNIAEVDPYQENPYVFKFRPFLWSYIPGAHFLQVRGDRKIPYEINSDGFRGKEIPPKEKARKRLLVVGDSMVEGQGVRFDETFAVRLSSSLEQSGWESINVGESGASPLYYASNIPRYLALQPDAVLVVLFENDLAEDRVREKEFQSLPVLSHPEVLSRQKIPFLDRLRIVDLIEDSLLPQPDEGLERLVTTNLKHIYVQSTADQSFQYASRHMIGPQNAWRWFHASSQYLNLFRTELRNRKIPMFISSFGFGKLQTPENEAFHRKFISYFNAATEQWGKRNRVPYLNLQKVVNATSESHDPDWYLLSDDGHPTAEMHQTIADAMAPWLAKHLTSGSHQSK